MNIIKTKIPDVIHDNIDQSKLILANNIIENVFPLFEDVYADKCEQSNVLKATLKRQSKKIQQQKESIENLSIEYKKRKKVSKALSRISKLIESGLIYDGSLKHETVVLLKIIDKLSEEKLDEQISKLVKFLNKRFTN